MVRMTDRSADAETLNSPPCSPPLFALIRGACRLAEIRRWRGGRPLPGTAPRLKRVVPRSFDLSLPLGAVSPFASTRPPSPTESGYRRRYQAQVLPRGAVGRSDASRQVRSGVSEGETFASPLPVARSRFATVSRRDSISGQGPTIT